MVLALTYMQSTGTIDADLQARATKYVDQGFKRLLTFESKQQPGGFGLWVDDRPSLFLSAYGFMQFTDMRRVYDVPEDLLRRIARFLKTHQQDDGSFGGGNLVHAWGSWKETPFYMTAYVAWALARAGEDTGKALAYLDAHAGEVDDPYGVALATLAHASADRASAATKRWAARLAEMRVPDGERVAWSPKGETLVGARGRTGDIEATAIATLALLQSKQRGDLAYAALDTLMAWRGKDGRFGPTNTTALALRALLEAEGGGDRLPETGVTIKHRDRVLKQVAIPAGSTEPVRVPLGTLDPRRVQVTLDGEGRLRGTLSRTTYEPWDQTVLPKGPLEMTVAWAKAPLEVDKAYTATVTIRHTGTQTARLVTAEVGLPPGITANPEDVTGQGLSEAERARRAMVLYLTDMAPGEARTYTIPFRTRHAFEALTAPSRVYEYYVEHEETVVPPVAVSAR